MQKTAGCSQPVDNDLDQAATGRGRRDPQSRAIAHRQCLQPTAGDLRFAPNKDYRRSLKGLRAIASTSCSVTSNRTSAFLSKTVFSGPADVL